MLFPIGEREKRIGEILFPVGKRENRIGKLLFPIGKWENRIGKLLFPIGKYEIPIPALEIRAVWEIFPRAFEESRHSSLRQTIRSSSKSSGVNPFAAG